MQKIQGFVEAGNTTLTITGAAGTISRKIQGSFPSATITVYKAGTLNLATIYSDNSLTAKANPFVAGSDGTWFFYAADGRFDVKFSGGSLGAPFTLGDFLIFDERAVFANVTDAQYGADNLGVADSSAAFTAALAAANIILVPYGVYRWNSTVTGMTTGKCMIAFGTTNRWRGSSPVTINFYGTTAAMSITPGVGVILDTICMQGIHLNGSNVNGAVDGILFDADAGGSCAIEGFIAENCTISDFPQYQVHSLRTVFDVTWRHCTFMNPNRAADNLIQIEYDGVAGAPSQWTFDDCWQAQYTAGKWCTWAAKATALSTNAIADLRFQNGTVTTAAGGAGANGIGVYGGIQVIGTHIENNDTTDTTNIGIMYTGSNGAFICPSNLSNYGRGITIGNPSVKTTEALGCIITGAPGFNNYGVGGVDCLIVDGGSRAGTGIMVMGFFTSAQFTLQNDRQTIDGNRTDLRFLFTNLNTSTQLSGPIGIGMTPDLWLTILALRNNGIGLRNASAFNQISARLIQDGADIGQLLLYDASESNRAVLNGSGLTAFSTIGAAAVAASAIMNLASTTRGFLPPRMTTAQRDAIAAPDTGLLIFNLTTGVYNFYNGAVWGAV
jgi:hypothetical protein